MNIFSGMSKCANCVREWDRLLRTQDWVSTEMFDDIFNFSEICGEEILAYKKHIKEAKKEIGIELAERGMSLQEKTDSQDERRKLTAYPSYNKDPLHDLRILAVLEQAMDFPQRALQLTYAQSYHQEEEHIFHAHYLKVYNGRYYVYGIYENEEENQGLPFMTLAVDRIVEARTTKDVPYRSENPKKYENLMKDVLGASPNFSYPEVREVVLRTHNPKVHKLLLTKPLHHSIREQQLCTNQQTGILTLRLQITQELINWILHYGIGVEILCPTELRAHVADIISAINNYYNK